LTGVGNRRYYEMLIDGALRRITQDAVTFLFFVDVDSFKLVNDQFGHASGDEVLKFVAAKLAERAGISNVARFGGDEFAVLASFPDPELASELATELCSFFCSKQFILQRSGERLDKLTVSIGAALLRSDDDKNSWIERTDKFLYAAKNGGRNRPMVERKII
jgi:diguanylate cyclase